MHIFQSLVLKMVVVHSNLCEIAKVLDDMILGWLRSFLSNLIEFFHFQLLTDELKVVERVNLHYFPLNQSELLAYAQDSKTQVFICKLVNSQTKTVSFLDFIHFLCCTTLAQ